MAALLAVIRAFELPFFVSSSWSGNRDNFFLKLRSFQWCIGTNWICSINCMCVAFHKSHLKMRNLIQVEIIENWISFIYEMVLLWEICATGLEQRWGMSYRGLTSLATSLEAVYQTISSFVYRHQKALENSYMYLEFHFNKFNDTFIFFWGRVLDFKLCKDGSH